LSIPRKCRAREPCLGRDSNLEPPEDGG
jgi:hypothetical protein